MINLLPPEEKIRRNNEKTLKIVWNIGIVLIACCIAFSFMLLGVKIYLSNQIELQKALIEYEKNKSTQVQTLRGRVDTINTTLSNLNNFYGNQFSSSILIDQVESLLPENVYLDIFTFQESGYKVSLSGYADTVEIVYQLRENLRRSFENVELELPDWLETEVINFRVEFTLKNDI